MKVLFAVLLFVSCFCVKAQVNDHFSDGDFTNDPTWSGDDSLFKANSAFTLQSKGTAGTSRDISLTTSSNYINDAEWQCLVKFNLSPSASNFCRFYALSDKADLKGSLNGYYVQFGGVTGNTDSITFYKQKGTTKVRIIAGRPSTVSKTNNTVRIKLTRTSAGVWELFSDTLGGTNFTIEGTGTDNEFTTSLFCGYFVKFTSSNISNYFLDDVYAGPYIIDNIPPTIDAVEVISSSILRVTFSEALETTSSTNPSNYSINKTIGTAIHAQLEENSNNVISLEFNNPLLNGTDYTITANGVKDLSNNDIVNEQINFTYFVPQKEDILISEFLPDPSPAIGLPEQEFIELYNRSNFTITIKDWAISDGTTTAVIPNADIKPDSFIIICSTSNTSLFSTFGKTVEVSSLPSLNNSGDVIILKDKQGNIIHQLNYNLDWYADNTKKDGGWSIELTNPLDLCKGAKTFSASTNVKGGTPGKQNSIWSKTPDTIAPECTTVKALSGDSVILLFNEKMDSISLATAAITITNGIAIINKVVKGELFDSLELQLSPSLLSSIPYIITISNVRDCNQNIIAPATTNTFTYFIPDTAKAYDIVIHEIFADPDPSIALPLNEFVELHNISSRIISLKNWSLEDGSQKAILPDIIILPDSFIIFTSIAAKSSYNSYGVTIGVDKFPSLSNDGETLMLKNEKGQIIHTLNYSSLWYNDNVKKRGGWSLEMIDAKNPCAGITNWSASKNNKGGTPGKQNSIRAINRDNSPSQLVRAYPIDDKKVELYFNEPLDSASIKKVATIEINGIGKSFSNALQPPFYNSFIAEFDQPFTPSTIYRVMVAGIKDCAENVISDNDYADFGLPEEYDSSDIIINEILFNPRTDGVDFVEIYNRSDKMVDLKKLFIANANEDHSIKDIYTIAPGGWLLFPHSYCAISENKEALSQHYFSPNTKNFIVCDMPSFNDDKGEVILIDAMSKHYDALSYDDNMHFPLLDDKDGVSLERIDFNRSGTDRTNWASASTNVRATPAYRNSQFAGTYSDGSSLSIDPEVFSPDNDGYKDVVNFSYSFTESGYTGNLYLFDSRGVLVKHLLRNEILGTTGTYSWNGITDKNEKATIGIYMVYFEVFNLKGEVKNYRSTLVVGGKM
jgi:hypothetical protein